MADVASVFTYKIMVDTKEMRLIGLALAGRLTDHTDKVDALVLNQKLIRLQRERLEKILSNLEGAEKNAISELACIMKSIEEEKKSPSEEGH